MNKCNLQFGYICYCMVATPRFKEKQIIQKVVRVTTDKVMQTPLDHGS